MSACTVCSNEVKWYERNEWIQTFHDWDNKFQCFLIRHFISTKKVQFKSFFLLFLYGRLEVIWLITFDSISARKKHFTCVVYILTLMRWGNIFWVDTISHVHWRQYQQIFTNVIKQLTVTVSNVILLKKYKKKILISILNRRLDSEINKVNYYEFSNNRVQWFWNTCQTHVCLVEASLVCCWPPSLELLPGFFSSTVPRTWKIFKGKGHVFKVPVT